MESDNEGIESKGDKGVLGYKMKKKLAVAMFFIFGSVVGNAYTKKEIIRSDLTKIGASRDIINSTIKIDYDLRDSPQFINDEKALEAQKKDLEDLLKYAGGLLINIGTLTDETWKLYQEALKIAEKYNVPAVLDPVACGAGAYRKKVSDDLINNYKLAAIRGNAGEIASLVGINVASKGVDSAGVDNIDEIALAANEKFNIPIIVTGEVDAIAVNGEVVIINNGSAMMPKVIGTGCLLGAVLASFIGLEKGQELKSLETAMLAYNIAGEMAEKRPNGHLPGTFKVEFINALYEVTDKDIETFKKVN